VVGSFEKGNKPSGSIKGGEFIDHLKNCQLLRRPLSAEWR
jgi:hypothetical protein